MTQKRVILLDRDGVLNRIVIDPEHGTIDSPLNPSQVEILPGVPEALRALCDAGYDLRIVTNQPGAAKGKTTLNLLESTHARIVERAESAGARILSSHLCLHRSEDQCSCRKPKTGLLEAALAFYSTATLQEVWMVGDGVTDVQAGAALQLKTAFLGPQKCDGRKIFDDLSVAPVFWGKDLPSFTAFLLLQK